MVSKKFEKLMSVAASKALESKMTNKHGALLLSRDGKQIIGSGCNNLERAIPGCVGLHAEVDGIHHCQIRKKEFKRGMHRSRGGRASPWRERGQCLKLPPVGC